MKYRSGYKYQLYEDETVNTTFYPDKNVYTHFIDFVKKLDLFDMPSGILIIRADYAWDGPSGPAIDTDSFMTGSLVHDALYQLMREGHLDAKTYKEPTDRLLQHMCLNRGMNPIRAWWVYRGVYRFGEGSTLPKSDKPILTAP